MTKSPITFIALGSINEIAAQDWDACIRPHATEPSGNQDVDSPLACNPFVSHAFLSALEDSGSACADTGWAPQHLVMQQNDEIVGIAPTYLKSHSRGEYVFDHGWAEAFMRAGGDYYPKLQVSVPFTPATGPRLLVRAGHDRAAISEHLAKGLIALCHQQEASSVHVTFAPEDEWRVLEACGFLPRIDQQFHWRNEGYGNFEDYLASMNARHRKAVRRERREAVSNGITIHWLTGADITEDALDAFFAFYMETGSRKYGRPYLTRAFYALIRERMPQAILLVMAKRNGKWIGGAINFIGADTLFGRHWGAIEHHPFLHFEVCYYQAIEFAIQHGLQWVEAGAQGEHKLARGYLPRTTYSAHYIAHPGLRRAIADYLAMERRHVEQAGEELAAYAPFRQAPNEPD